MQPATRARKKRILNHFTRNESIVYDEISCQNRIIKGQITGEGTSPHVKEVAEGHLGQIPWRHIMTLMACE